MVPYQNVRQELVHIVKLSKYTNVAEIILDLEKLL